MERHDHRRSQDRRCATGGRRLVRLLRPRWENQAASRKSA
jgi:hypothetical protein